jgi:phage gpG-like protein
MTNNNSITFGQLEKKYKTFRSQIPRRIAMSTENFFKRNFQVQGFVDQPFKKWPERKNPKDKGRAILVKSGKLRRAIKPLKITEKVVVVGVGEHIPYAALHNSGGKIKVTPKMRRFFWAKYMETQDEYYKSLALTKKQYLTMPKRQFIGESKALYVALDRMIARQLEKALQ